MSTSITFDRPPYPTAPNGTRSARSTIYRVAGLAAALAAVATPISIGVFAIWPPPAYDEGARVWFEHIQDNPLLGLMSLDLPFLVISALMIPVMLALFLALREFRPAHIVIAGVLYLVAIATYFGTNTSFEMMSLSNRWADAATEAQRISLLGAGEATLAAFNGTAFHVNYILAQAAGIIFGFAMLHSHIFSRRIAYLMITGNAFGYLLYLPQVGVALSAFSGVILWLWMILISRRLLELARDEAEGRR